MRKRVGVFIVGAALAACGLVFAAEVPVAVSPGRADMGAVVEARCPTFSWDAVPGAAAHELVVYQVGKEGQDAEPVLKQQVPGSSSSWTPALESCLERGNRYAWSVRAVAGKKASEWSSPSLFEVASGPSEAEFEAALQVVRQYLGQEAPGRVEGAVGIEESSGAVSSTTVAGSPEAASAGPAPRSVAMGDSALQVNGSPVVTVATLEAGCLGRRWLDQGDGTVLDCNTRLVWLKDGSCLGTGTWGLHTEVGTVQRTVGFLNIGIIDFDCLDYVPGTYNDWRVPEIEELCSAGAVVGRCPVADYATSLVDTRFGIGVPTATLSNAAGDGGLNFNDPFVRPNQNPYWSATAADPTAPDSAWIVRLDEGNVSVIPKTRVEHVWPVRCSTSSCVGQEP